MTVTWITTEDVEEALGTPPASAADTAYLATVTAAAQVWAYESRVAAGYDDDPDAPPSDRVKLGAVLMAVSLYRERASVDSFQSFDAMPTVVPFGSMGQILRMLGLRRPRVA